MRYGPGEQNQWHYRCWLIQYLEAADGSQSDCDAGVGRGTPRGAATAEEMSGQLVLSPLQFRA